MRKQLWSVKVCGVQKTCGTIQVSAETRGDAAFLAIQFAHEGMIPMHATDEYVEVETCECAHDLPPEKKRPAAVYMRL